MCMSHDPRVFVFRNPGLCRIKIWKSLLVAAHHYGKCGCPSPAACSAAITRKHEEKKGMTRCTRRHAAMKHHEQPSIGALQEVQKSLITGAHYLQSQSVQAEQHAAPLNLGGSIAPCAEPIPWISSAARSLPMRMSYEAREHSQQHCQSPGRPGM